MNFFNDSSYRKKWQTITTAPHKWQRWENQINNIDRKWLRNNLKGKVLDLGCGSCFDAKYYKNYTGIDITKSFLIAANKNYGVKKILLSDGRSLPFKDKAFDSCYSKDVLLHYPFKDSIRFIKEMLRVSTNVYIAWGIDKDRINYVPRNNIEVNGFRKGFYYNIFDINKLKNYFNITVIGGGTSITMINKKYIDVTFYGDVSIKKNVIIGKNTCIGEFVVLGENARIGNNCRIMYHVTICKDAQIGNNVFIGPNTSLLNDKYPPSKDSLAPIIEDNAVIGGGCTILPGVKIGKSAFIGAGSVVTKSVASGKRVFGNPAIEK